MKNWKGGKRNKLQATDEGVKKQCEYIYSQGIKF